MPAIRATLSPNLGWDIDSFPTIDEGASLQPSRRRLLFESAALPIQCCLEQMPRGASLQRLANTQTEEILLVRDEFDCDQKPHRETYCCLPPQEPAPPLHAGGLGATFLRLVFGTRRCDSLGPTTADKPRLDVLDFTGLAWNEIPLRRENDPGARTAELSTNQSRTRITTLMDCRPGWQLHEHDHPSDVLTFCIKGGGLLGIEEQECAYDAGQLVVIPAGIKHRFEAGKEGAFLATFVFEPFLS